MERMRVVITEPLPGKRFGDFVADDRYDIVLLSHNTEASLYETVEKHNPHALITLLSDRVDKELIDAAPALKIIANYAVGYNNIDCEYAQKKGAFVTNTPGVLTDATADIAMLLMLMVARRALEADRFMRNGHFTGWMPSLMTGMSLNGKVLGIVGFGRIGQAVAKRAQAFGMSVVYTNKSGRPLSDSEWASQARYCDFEELIAVSDVVSLHLPFSENVRHLFDADVFNSMKKDAIFVNTARGPLVDEQALIAALRSGHLFGAGLDVYEHEPLFSAELAEMNSVVLFPHIGSATVATREKMAEMVIESCEAVFAGKVPKLSVIP